MKSPNGDRIAMSFSFRRAVRADRCAGQRDRFVGITSGAAGAWSASRKPPVTGEVESMRLISSPRVSRRWPSLKMRNEMGLDRGNADVEVPGDLLVYEPPATSTTSMTSRSRLVNSRSPAGPVSTPVSPDAGQTLLRLNSMYERSLFLGSVIASVLGPAGGPYAEAEPCDGLAPDGRRSSLLRPHRHRSARRRRGVAMALRILRARRPW